MGVHLPPEKMSLENLLTEFPSVSRQDQSVYYLILACKSQTLHPRSLFPSYLRHADEANHRAKKNVISERHEK